MLHDVGAFGDEPLGAVLHGQDAGNDGLAQIAELLRLVRRIIDHAVDVAGHAQLEGRQADILGAFLPGQIEPLGDAGQTLRLDGAEHPVPHRQQQVAGRQGNGAAGIAEAVDQADAGHIQVAGFGDQPGNAVRLIAAVGVFAGIRAGRVHEGDDGDAAAGAFRQIPGRAQVVLRPPDAILRRPVLGDEAQWPDMLAAIHFQNGAVEGAVGALPLHLAQLPNDRRGRGSGLALRRRAHRFDVGIYVQAGQPPSAPRHLLAREEPGQGFAPLHLGEQGGILGQAFGYEEELVPFVVALDHAGCAALAKLPTL